MLLQAFDKCWVKIKIVIRKKNYRKKCNFRYFKNMLKLQKKIKERKKHV